jgi:Fe-S cluster assembly protein SufD
MVKQDACPAVERAGTLKVPATRGDEEWRFTGISPLAQLSFQPVREISPLQREDIERFYLDEAFTTLVFVDGHYMPGLSTESKGSGAGLIVTNLRHALTQYAKEIEPHLGKYADFHDNLFAALNTAFLHDGAMIIAPRNSAVERPVHLLFVSTQAESANHPRCLLIAGPGSAVTFVEDYVTLQEGEYVTNAVKIAIEDNAQGQPYEDSARQYAGFHVANCA